ncbi:MAG TPA: hypothetical protein PKE55_12790, partial [Kiritimatiellia bacterium]|nr:hypothetical protein [Kiritimatiellia bacterium]
VKRAPPGYPYWAGRAAMPQRLRPGGQGARELCRGGGSAATARPVHCVLVVAAAAAGFSVAAVAAAEMPLRRPAREVAAVPASLVPAH